MLTGRVAGAGRAGRRWACAPVAGHVRAVSELIAQKRSTAGPPTGGQNRQIADSIACHLMTMNCWFNCLPSQAADNRLRIRLIAICLVATCYVPSLVDVPRSDRVSLVPTRALRACLGSGCRACRWGPAQCCTGTNRVSYRDTCGAVDGKCHGVFLQRYALC